jgi:hypothetical protein
LDPGDRPPAEIIVDIEAWLDAEIDWTPSVLAVYRGGMSETPEAVRSDVTTILARPEPARNYSL